jgi:two-component system, chemotaxis family, chemotaxis protein CheY
MSLNVLVVDDSAVMRAMIVRSLRLAGLRLGEVSQAANGAEGLNVLNSKWIDLAIVDINMPLLNGEEMIDRIRQNPSIADLPVVVVSTESNAARIESLRKKGAEFVHKPFTPEDLRRKIVCMTGVRDEQCGGEDALSHSGGDF